MQGKVDICGMNTAQLPLLSGERSRELLRRSKAGDEEAREELIEAEKAFLEEETRKLQKKFLKEKKELKARFVAERQANYCMVAEAGLEA